MISLLVLLPVILLLLAAVGILILQQARPSIGYAWLIAALVGFVTVGLTIFLRWRLPLQLTIDQWRPFADLSSPFVFRLDSGSWPYVFCLAVLALAFILTDAARLETEARPFNWAGGLALAGLGMLAVMAGNPFTLVVIWTAVDLAEFLMVIATNAGRRMGVQTVTIFSVRVLGTLLVILAILYARSRAIGFDLTPIPAALAIFMLLASGLRLGVLPLNLPYTREVYAWRGLGNVMRLIGPASSLAVLGRMPDQFVPPEWKGIFLAFSALAALYGAGAWLTTDNELNGRPFWSITLAAFAVASVINGYPQASIAWGSALILSGSVLFFFSARRKQIWFLFIPALGLLGITGLPYSPAASGWYGLASGSFNFFTFSFLFAAVLLIWGYLRHLLRSRDELYRMERWVQTVYPLGMILLILCQWVIGILGWRGSFTVGIWWASVSVTFIAALGMVVAFTFRRLFSSDAISSRWVVLFARRTGGLIGDLFRLNWLYNFFAWLYRVLQNVIQLLTTVFEGDGGILWSLVMLALLISLIWTGGTH